MQNLFILRLKL